MSKPTTESGALQRWERREERRDANLAAELGCSICRRAHPAPGAYRAAVDIYNRASAEADLVRTLGLCDRCAEALDELLARAAERGGMEG